MNVKLITSLKSVLPPGSTVSCMGSEKLDSPALLVTAKDTWRS